ncbi:spore-associated protein A [Streptomyces sp. cg36]|uniref:spore-associated protein A n=1 Tax=Streptomyces sp. cg36 TaxID=3238798 RepID=UPI0034E2654F
MFFSAGPAAAGVASYDGGCGSGFREIDHVSMYRPADGAYVGTGYLTYNANTGENCAVLQVAPADPTKWVFIGIRRSDGEGRPVWDEGYFSQYAGPVTVSAAGACIIWDGFVGDDNNDTSSRAARFHKGPYHCD